MVGGMAAVFGGHVFVRTAPKHGLEYDAMPPGIEFHVSNLWLNCLIKNGIFFMKKSVTD
jgi:hypothetical protein